MPPANCHTLSEVSLEPVMRCSESALSAMHVTSCEWLTVKRSSSRFSDQMRRLRANQQEVGPVRFRSAQGHWIST